MTAAEAATFVKDGFNVGLSGFTPAGSPKVVIPEVAKLAREAHDRGEEFKINLFTGASTGDSADGQLVRADALRYRAPYTTNGDFRKAVNAGKIAYNDMHLSQMAQELRYGFFGKLDIAIVEALDVTDEGEIYITTGGGISPTVCSLADKIIIELNSAHSMKMKGLHDMYEPLDPPARREIPIYKPSDHIGTPYIKVDPSKIVGIVETHLPDEARPFTDPDEVTTKIGQNVATFLANEMKRGVIPAEFAPIQSGVGNVANAVLAALGEDESIPPFEMYTEVIQDSVIKLMKEGHIKFGSTSSLSVSNEYLDYIYENIEFFKDRLVIRPTEISNNPEVARRLGLISINTALEADIYGNVNSTQVCGSKMMNGIGGSADFTRNAFISIFTCPSTAKGGAISSIVPMVSHVDHNEHSVNILITEQGIADLRGKSPKERAEAIISNCVHPDYQPILREYLNMCATGHTPHNLRAAFGMHIALMEKKDMKQVDWNEFK